MILSGVVSAVIVSILIRGAISTTIVATKPTRMRSNALVTQDATSKEISVTGKNQKVQVIKYFNQ